MTGRRGRSRIHKCLITASGILFLVLLRAVCAQTLSEQVQQAAQGDQRAYTQILAAGMQTHNDLKIGTPDTAELRRRLRRDLRQQRDAMALSTGLVVHENGVSFFLQNGNNEMIESAPETTDDLPPWVHLWSRTPSSGHSEILRNPIIRFYAEKPVSVNVAVNNNHGMLTQWWPEVTRFFPPRPLAQADVMWRAGGRLDWLRLLVNPYSAVPLLEVPAGSWWSSARAVDAAPVTINGVTEKFLFYRGVSRRAPLVRIEAQAGHVKIENVSNFLIHDLLVVNVKKGRVRHHVLSMFGPKASMVLDTQVSAADAVENAAPRLVEVLRECLEGDGLFPGEADAMLRNWSDELFHSDGLRVIYLRPVQELQTSLILSLAPVPDSLVRVFVTVVECLAPDAEADVKALIADLSAVAFEQREAAQHALEQRAALWQDLLKAARAQAEDPEAQDRLDQILSTLKSPLPGSEP